MKPCLPVGRIGRINIAELKTESNKFMKLLFVVITLISIIFINLSCSNDNQGGNNQPATNNSEEQQAQKESASQNNNKTASASKYEFPDNNGIGPIKEVSVGTIDQNLVSQGTKIFNMKCMACHQLDSRNVGPPLRNVTKKYNPVYIMNYLLNTTDMQRKDTLMQKLVAEYKIIMPDQVLTRDDARALLEYFRSLEK